MTGATPLINDEMAPLLFGSCRATGTATAYPAAPDPFYGYGIVDANEAVTKAVAYKRHPVGAGDGWR